MLGRDRHAQDTAFWVPEDKQHRLVYSYEDDGQGGLQRYTGHHLGVQNRMERDPAFESGGAGLASTIGDYSRFAGLLMNQGTVDGVTLLKPRTVRYLTSPALTSEHLKQYEKIFPHMRGYNYGNLMRISAETGRAGFLTGAGEYGWDGWLGTHFCNCPAERLTLLFMTQRKSTETAHLTRRLRNLALASFA